MARKRPVPRAPDDQLIREWFLAHTDLKLSIIYSGPSDAFVVLVLDHDGDYVGEGGMSKNLTHAILSAIDAAEQVL